MRDPLPPIRRLLAELERRRVYRVGAAYLVAGFVVVQVADLAAGVFGLPSWFEPLVWVLSGLGLPIALVLAWAYDVEPDGIRRAGTGADRAPEGAPAGATPSGGHRGVGTLVILGLPLAAAGGWYLFGADEPEITDRSIAVLPFESTGGEESARFSAGLHDDLLTRLTNVADLTVKSRTSSERYERTDKSIPEIARELGVGWIVEGGVHRAGDRTRVHATLIEAHSEARMAQELEPSWAVAYADEGLFLSDAGRHREALTALERALDLSAPGSFSEGLALAALGVVHAHVGEAERARAMVTRLQERGESPFWVALVRAALGENDAAFRALDEVEWTSTLKWDLLVFRALGALRDDPRYGELTRELNREWGLNPDGSLPGN